jgi:hypothetical protein
LICFFFCYYMICQCFSFSSDSSSETLTMGTYSSSVLNIIPCWLNAGLYYNKYKISRQIIISSTCSIFFCSDGLQASGFHGSLCPNSNCWFSILHKHNCTTASQRDGCMLACCLDIDQTNFPVKTMLFACCFWYSINTVLWKHVGAVHFWSFWYYICLNSY